jgi:hypothetical protein
MEAANMDAEPGEHVLGVDHDVEEMRYRRALVAAHIGDAGLQQRLGDGQNAFAAKDIAVAEPECLDFLGERAFHPGFQSFVPKPSYIGGGATCARAATAR